MAHYRLLVALLLGIALGSLAHSLGGHPWLDVISSQALHPIGQIFLRMIFMIVVPMLLSALILGILELGQGKGLKKIATKSMLFTLLFSTFSVIIGVVLVNLLQPGKGFSTDPAALSIDVEAVKKIQVSAQAAKPLSQIIIELVPRNPLDSALKALDGEIIALMVFGIIFGLALSKTIKDPKQNSWIKSGLEEISAVCMNVVGFAMKLAPLAVFSMVFNTSYKLGHSIFGTLVWYILAVVLGLLFQQFVVYTIALRAFTDFKPFDFFRRCREVYLYAFSTASSNATLPKSLSLAEGPLGIKPQISRFVLTVGSTANQNGTALFEGVTVLFLAQVYGIELSVLQQAQVVVMSIVAGVGTAGVPGGSLPLIMILLQSVGVPAEGLGLILGVDRFLDMCRTTLNVSGDLVIAAVVQGRPTSKMKKASIAHDHA